MPTMESYSAMLLTLALSPDKEEYARPLSTAEYREVCELTKNSSVKYIGKLASIDISGIRMLLGISEEYAYRIYMLMNRQVPLSYAIEQFMAREIAIVTEHDDEYPARLRRRAGLNAPPAMYVRGDGDNLNKPAIGVMGISGVRTTAGMRESLRAIAEFAAQGEYRVIIGGEHGVSRVAEGFMLEYGCDVVCAAAGGMGDYMNRPEARRLMDAGKLTVVSLEHPDAPFTVPRAISRNKLMMCLAEAVYIFNTDMKRGETDALRGKYCSYPYAWSAYPENRALIAKGATAVDAPLTVSALNELSRQWQTSRSVQLSIFDFDDY